MVSATVAKARDSMAAEHGFKSHQGPSQLSHFLDWPAGGGVSPNRLPPGSCFPSAKKLPPPPAPRVLAQRRAVRGSLRASSDIAVGSLCGVLGGLRSA